VKYAAFFRNIMVGRKGLTRAVLVAAFERAGGLGVTSFLATGNIIFTAEDDMAAHDENAARLGWVIGI
jgi:uncharacterized protein (DUF1697 family)